ncbi:MAG: GGDEF domain-containing protein [Actinobacteria bacterium]|nr:GGDEF domain-containing protein [Actinomycetota bacterium]
MTEPDSRYVVADNEPARLAALHALGVLDQPRTTELDELARLAAYVCGTPTAVVNLIDTDRQWSAAAHGYEPTTVSRDESMCATSILNLDVSYTPDASLDPRWSSNPFVTGQLDSLRLYASAPLILPDGEVIGTVCAFSDESRPLTRVQLERLRDIAAQTVRMLQLRQAAAQLRQAATRDVVTGLPNRVLFEESLRLAVARSWRDLHSAAVVFIDLDAFKSVNDSYGHAAGDELLRAVANRLLQTMRASDLLARLAGDELVILCDLAATVDREFAVDSLITRLRDAFATPFELSAATVSVGASLGVAFTDGGSAEQLLARADAAMYRDKSNRRAKAS